MKTLFKNIVLLPMDGRAPVEDAVLCVDGQMIRYAGPRASAPEFAPERVIDGRGRIAMPGLVNAHTHVPMTLLRGAGSDLPLNRWLTEAIFPLEDRMTGEDVHWGAMLGIMEMLRFGCTAFLDMYMFMEDIARAVEKTGVRATLSRCVIGTGNDALKRLDESEALYRNWHGSCGGRLRVMVSLHGEYTTDSDIVTRVASHARELGCGVNVHVSETYEEHEGCMQRHGITPTEYLAKLGLFDGHTVAAHCVAITRRDAEILQEKGVYVAHNPISNLKLGSGVMPVYDGLLPRTALGTDGAASNNTLNMFEELRFAALLHKGILRDPTRIGAEQAIKMSTAIGAEALGFDDIGTLTEGMKADVILVDTSGPHAAPMPSPAAHIAYAAQGSDVSLTMVDGNVLYQEGSFPTFDADEVLAKAAECAIRLVSG